MVVALVLWPGAGLVAALTQLDDVRAGALYLASLALLAVVAVAVLALGRSSAGHSAGRPGDPARD